MNERRPSWFDPELEKSLEPASREAIAWFNRLRADRVSDEDRAAFTAWLQRDLAHARAFQEIEDLWRGMSDLPQARRRRRKAVTRRAVGKGVLTLALAGGAWAAYRAHPFADYRTGTGERRTVRLPDGSRADLATATALSMSIGPSERRLTLHKGETYFEVAPDKQRPFIVEAGSGSITALGTAFAVSDAGDRVLVTVTQHAVLIDAAASRRRLEAGLQTAFDSRSIAPPVAVDEAEALAWREGRLIFVNADLGKVVEALNRWRSGHIVVMGHRLAMHPVTLIVNLDDVDGALHQLEDALPIALTSVTPYFTLIHAR
ncbi:MAG: FecR domain-containing protein [Hyphomicrobiaceae bacterium]